MEARLLSLRRQPGAVLLRWEDGLERALAVRALRLACPCALCVHEVTGKPLLDPAGVAADVGLQDMQPVGNYAYRILFSDGHDSGIYTLERLRGLAEAAPGTPA